VDEVMASKNRLIKKKKKKKKKKSLSGDGERFMRYSAIRKKFENHRNWWKTVRRSHSAGPFAAPNRDPGVRTRFYEW